MLFLHALMIICNAYNTICLIIDVKYKILINYYSFILHDNSNIWVNVSIIYL